MSKRARICPAGLLAAGLLLLPACIPSSAPAPAPAAAPAAPVSPKAEEPGRVSLHFDSRPMEEMNASAELAPLPDGTGYQLTGTYNLQATLVRGAAGTWNLQGTLQFPTGGFSVGEPSLMDMGDIVLDGTGDVELRQATSHVMLQIPIQIPAKDAVVTQALEVVPLKAEIAAPHSAQFMVLLVSG